MQGMTIYASPVPTLAFPRHCLTHLPAPASSHCFLLAPPALHPPPPSPSLPPHRTFQRTRGSAASGLVSVGPGLLTETSAEFSESSVSSSPARHSTRPWDLEPTSVMRPLMVASTAARSMRTMSLYTRAKQGESNAVAEG